MYKDLISYELAEGKTKEQLLDVAQRIIDEWMKKLPGFIKWEIHESDNGVHYDIVYWEDEASAKNAEKEMMNIPNAAEWYGCYKPETISGKKMRLLREF